MFISKSWKNIIRQKGLLALMALLMVSLMLAACGDETADNSGSSKAPATTGVAANPGNSAPSAKIDPCSLVSQAEFDSIWGIQSESAKEVESLSEGYDSSCDYDSPKTLVSLFVNRAGKVSAVTGKDNSATFDSLRKLGKDVQDVPGVGDKAMWDARFEQLLVVKNNVLLMVNITDSDHSPTAMAEKEAKSIALARKAVTRIS